MLSNYIIKKYYILFLGTGILVLYFLILFFLPRYPGLDQSILYTVIYSYVEDDILAYPSGYNIPLMWIQPPTKYFLVGILHNLGMSVNNATGILLFLFITVTLFCIGRGAFSFPLKLNLMTGLMCGLSFVYLVGYSIEIYPLRECLGMLRPDDMVAVCWYGGLVCLESARKKEWVCKWEYFFGGLFFSFSAFSHYYGIIGLSGIGIYLFLMWKKLNVRSFGKNVLLLILGFLTVAIPVLVSLIPYLNNVVTLINNTAFANPAYGIKSAIKSNIDHYITFKYLISQNFFFTLLPSTLLWPALALKIPPLLVGFICMVVCKELRILGFSMLPLPLFIFIVSYKSAGYFIPEFIMYLVGVIGVILYFISRMSLLLQKKNKLILWGLITLFLFISFIFSTPILAYINRLSTEQPYDMDVTRAVSRRIVGDNAVIQSYQRYVTGETSHITYPTSLDLLKSQHFDSIVINSRNGASSEASALYASKMMNLLGFYIVPEAPFASNIFITTKKKERIEGYVNIYGNIFHFEPDVKGDKVFVMFVCEIDHEEYIYKKEFDPGVASVFIPTTHICLKHFLEINTIFDPIISCSAPVYRYKDNEPYLALVAAIIDRELFNMFQSEILCSCSCNIRELKYGYLVPVDRKILHQELSETDQKIRFYYSLNDFLSGKDMISNFKSNNLK